MKYKLICSDLDDTLLTSDGVVPKEVKDAINRYVDRGGKFCLVTGRMTAGALPICAELNLFGEVITFQGAVISDISTGQILDTISLTTEDAVAIGKYLEERGVYYQTYVRDVFITEKATDYTVLYGRISRAVYEETGIKLSKYIETNKLTPPKILLIAPEETIPALKEELRAHFGEKYLINTSKPFLIEIIPRAINKAVAVEKLAKKYNIKREEIICVGDSENDLPMIDYAGLGVVVNNAPSSVKEHADVIAPSNDEYGLAWVIDNYGYIK